MALENRLRLADTPREERTNLIGYLRRAEMIRRIAAYPDRPSVRPGQVVSVVYDFAKSSNEPVEFRGLVIAVRGKDISTSFTVYAIVDGCGSEQVFQLYSPMIRRITVLGCRGRGRRRPPRR